MKAWLIFLMGIVAGIASCGTGLVAVALKRGVAREMARSRTLVLPCRRAGKTASATKLLAELRQDEGRRVWS